MELNIPDHLETTRNILAGSLRFRSDEAPPSIPQDLLSDLTHRFTPTHRIIVEPPKHSVSILERAMRFFSTPAMGATALIALVLSFAATSLVPEQAETTRGGYAIDSSLAKSPTSILLAGGPYDIVSALGSIGDLEVNSLIQVESMAATSDIAGAKVIVDFKGGAILSLNSSGETVSSAEIPADLGDLSMAIVQAVSQLADEE